MKNSPKSEFCRFYVLTDLAWNWLAGSTVLSLFCDVPKNAWNTRLENLLTRKARFFLRGMRPRVACVVSKNNLRITSKCMCICWASLEIKGPCPILNEIGSVQCLYTPVSPSAPEMEGVHATGGHPSLRMYVWWSVFMYLALTSMPGGVPIGNSGLSCYVPCLIFFLKGTALSLSLPLSLSLLFFFFF